MNRLLKGTLFLAAGVLAAGVYLRIDHKTAPGDSGAARSNGALLKAHITAIKTQGQDQHEREVLRMALKKSPGHAPVLLKLAEIESRAGQLQDAAGHLRQILQTEPGNTDANLELGKVLFELGDIRGAIAHTESILKTHPLHEEALYNMGAIYANIGNKAGAVTYWQRLSSLHSNSANAQRAQLMMKRLETSNP